MNRNWFESEKHNEGWWKFLVCALISTRTNTIILLHTYTYMQNSIYSLLWTKTILIEQMNTDLIEEIILNVYMTSTLNQQNCQLMNSRK